MLLKSFTFEEKDMGSHGEFSRYEDMTLEEIVQLYEGVKSDNAPDWVLEDIKSGITEKIKESNTLN